ncbi:hypothetical protein AUF78_15460 [archaeon 13_1_20CM_2_51_12]|nr:MAG: hypothetical protein AUF78_15460 [archaeon 13_1_20CM_2_51_12]
MSGSTSEKFGFLRKVDLLTLSGALLALFVALGSEPWWTLTGASTSNLLNIQVSPFYLHINALGLPSTTAAANGLGSFTRVLLILGSLALLAASLQPTAWWRNLAVYLGLSSLVELYFSFVLIYYWAETAIVQAYGVVPPYYGTTSLQTTILGLDLRYYTSPLVTATFYFPYYLGFLGLAMVLGRSLIRIIQDRAFQILGALLPGGHIHDVYLTPPYQHVWFNSNDREFNPLGKDPKMLNDDELLISFQKLYDTVEPGGSLSIILPDWDISLGDRFEKLMPATGFEVESSGTVYRIPGRPENELRFRKPVQEKATPIETQQAVEEPAPPATPLPPIAGADQAVDSEHPPMIEVVQSPNWSNDRITRPERAMLKSAVTIIVARGVPVPYRELLNQVYMELVEKKVDFDSARQIETTLLKHNGREILLVQEADETGTRALQKWWLGDQQMAPEKARRFPILGKITRARPKLPRPQGLLTRFQKPRYERRATNDYDSDSERSNS